MRHSIRLLVLAHCLFVPIWVAAQSAPPAASSASPSPAPAQPAPKLDYPDSPSGLEHLAKDILKAQRENDAARADALLNSLVLPNAQDWYARVFGPGAANNVGAYYDRVAASLPPSLARSFLNSAQGNFSEISAKRFEHSCDDNAPDDTYGLLLRRREPVPLYDLRFSNGTKFVRLFPLVYVDGSFRFLLPPDFRPPAPPAPPEKDSPPPQQKPPSPDQKPSAPEEAPATRRIRMGGAVQAAKLINRVQPHYPETARLERVQGIVKIHAIIGKDGSVSHISDVRGICTLAESAVAAVRQWRYSPTLLLGRPVEVDTEIDVIFSLQQ